MSPRQHAKRRPGLERLLDRVTAVIAISLIAVSGGLLAELNQQAKAEARIAPFAQSATAAGG